LKGSGLHALHALVSIAT
jgi:hypothetical protein